MTVQTGSRAPAASPEVAPLSWSRQLAPAAVLSALGLVVVAEADNLGRAGRAAAQPLFFVGLVVLVLPLAVNAMLQRRPRGERLVALLVLASGLFLVKVCLDPTLLPGVDELQELRSFLEAQRSHHLFGANPFTPSYGVYPGLVAVTDALTRLSGVSPVVAALALLGALRLVAVGCLYLLVDRAFGSHRLAAGATLVYLCNPSFLFYGSEFGYESLAIPLAFAALYAAACIRPTRRFGPPTAMALLAALIAAAVAASHHMTSLWLSIVFLVWVGLGKLVDRRGESDVAAFPALVCVAATAAWFVFVSAPEVRAELGPVFTGVWHGLQRLAEGRVAVKQPFQTGHVPVTDPPLARYVAYASVVLCLLALPLGLYEMLAGFRRRALALVLGLPGLLYPLSLLIRLASSGTETANRTSEFLFVGVGVCAALTVRALVRMRRRVARHRQGRYGVRPAVQALVVGSLLYAVLFAGGLIVGTAPYDRVPGPYLPSGDTRGVSPQGVAAAVWAGQYLRPGGVFVADANDQLLLGSYGLLDPRTGYAGRRRSVADVILDPRLRRRDVRIIRYDKIAYVVTDRRLTRILPANGFYVDGVEPKAGRHTRPLAASAIDKFARVRLIGRIYDNGPVAIWSVGALLR